jgi:hypothetical protein
MPTQRTARIKPEDVKMPEDHLAPLGDFDMQFEGEKFTVHGKLLRDYNTIILLSQVDRNAGVLPSLLTRLIGQEQHDLLIKILTEDDGFVDIERIGDFLRAAVAKGQGKNS